MDMLIMILVAICVLVATFIYLWLCRAIYITLFVSGIGIYGWFKDPDNSIKLLDKYTEPSNIKEDILIFLAEVIWSVNIANVIAWIIHLYLF